MNQNKTLEFSIDRENVINRFIQWETGAAHLFWEPMPECRLGLCFPGGNVGVQIRFCPLKEQQPLTVRFESIEPCKDKALQKIRFNLVIDGGPVEIIEPVLDSIRVIRSNSIPEIVTKSKQDNITPNVTGEDTAGLSITSIPGGGIEFSSNLPGEKKILFQMILKTSGRFDTSGSSPVLYGPEGAPLNVTVTAATNYKPLTPYPPGGILTVEATKKLNKIIKKRPEIITARNALGFLCYQEKLLAGSWRYLTYFGRDTLMTTLLLFDHLQPQVVENAFKSVVERLSPQGAVCHEEEIGPQAAYRQLEKQSGTNGSKSLPELENVEKPVYDYKMIDDDFMLPILGNALLHRSGCSRALLQSSLMEPLAGNLNYILKKAMPFYESGKSRDMVAINPKEQVGDWRDSNRGLGWGRYPASVNVYLIPTALKALDCILNHEPVREILEKICRERLPGSLLRTALNDRSLLSRMCREWNKAPSRFLIRLSPGQLRERLSRYFKHGPIDDEMQKALLIQPVEPGITLNDFLSGKAIPNNLTDGLEFHALSLDENTRPVEVVHTDGGFGLFLGTPDSQEVDRQVKLLTLPFPLGLALPAGPAAANSALSGNQRLWTDLDFKAYHGTVVWSWQMAMLHLGFVRQLERFRNIPGKQDTVKLISAAIDKLEEMEKQAGPLSCWELWTHRENNGRILPVPYGSPGDETSSNPVQLWSCVNLALALL